MFAISKAGYEKAKQYLIFRGEYQPFLEHSQVIGGYGLLVNYANYLLIEEENDQGRVKCTHTLVW